MEKIWYILIDGVREGPFSVPELKKDLRLTPATLVWREGFEDWVPMGKVAELKTVFEEEEAAEEEEEPAEPLIGETEVALQIKEDPPSLLPLFLLIVLCLLLYIMTKLFL